MAGRAMLAVAFFLVSCAPQSPLFRPTATPIAGQSDTRRSEDEQACQAWARFEDIPWSWTRLLYGKRGALAPDDPRRQDLDAALTAQQNAEARSAALGAAMAVGITALLGGGAATGQALAAGAGVGTTATPATALDLLAARLYRRCMVERGYRLDPEG